MVLIPSAVHWGGCPLIRGNTTTLTKAQSGMPRAAAVITLSMYRRCTLRKATTYAIPMTDPRRTATGMFSRVMARTKLLRKPASSPVKPERRYLDLLYRAFIFPALLSPLPAIVICSATFEIVVT
jgi:hypothetical protein